MPNDLTELAARLETLTGPSRLVDEEIALADGYRDVHGDGSLWDRGNDGYWTGNDDRATADCPALPAYTASLDAAMTLVPEGWVGSMAWDAEETIVRLFDDRVNPVRLPTQEAAAATPALALCAAALRSRQANGEMR